MRLAYAKGTLIAAFAGIEISLGSLSAATLRRALKLSGGLALNSFTAGRRSVDREIAALVRRLARYGLLEYRLHRPASDSDQVVIEPQIPEYWPQTPRLGNTDILVLSRFAYMRRRGNDIVLESPRAPAVFKIISPAVAAALALLCRPQPVKKLIQPNYFNGLPLLALMVHSQLLFQVPSANHAGLRAAEGDKDLVLWDFHDLLFHSRSTEGRHANPVGGAFAYVDTVPPLPALRPTWTGKRIDLCRWLTAQAEPLSPFAKLLHERHSTRSFDESRPVTLAEVAHLLQTTARVLSTWATGVGGDAGPVVTYARRPYPSAGASYELELYLGVDQCQGLDRGFYHYDAGGHALVLINSPKPAFEALLKEAQRAMEASSLPQILITIAARFGRVSWKYSALAYALILKDVGVLTQTLYLAATEMGLGGCAIGTTNIDLFAKITGVEFHVEGLVGQFALGRPNREAR